jgi:hypothetical protein
LPKYYLSEAKCGDYGKNPKGLTLLPKALVCLGRLIFAGFFIFLSVNIILKKSLLYLSFFEFGFESFWKKKPFLIKNQKDPLHWGKLAAGMTATAGNGWKIGMGMTEGTEYME